MNQRLFLVHYRFLSCGDVFTRGLESAADALGLEWQGAHWDAPDLPAAVARFRPDLLFVVHGRRFRQRWSRHFQDVNRAVWLLDEPYEVDDTAVTSRLFQTVFVNDPSTLGRHRNAHYLPVAWDSVRHTPGPEDERTYACGFVGGGNPTREAMLLRLAREGLLSYVVGGPWRSRELQALSLGSNVPAARTTELYRRTRVVVNVFRDRHHYNRQDAAATSLNPRVYEALACGALVVTEDRPERAALFPSLPSFRDADELVEHVRGLLADDARRLELLRACRTRLAGHSYADRLRFVMERAVGPSPPPDAPPERSTVVMSDPVPTYSVLMAVHGGLDVTRLSVLRTLRHIERSDARLVVVDNASADGTGEWLRLLHRRGDLDLVALPENRGHGPALEIGRARTASPYLVTLDSDAFPLADDWLVRLRARLDEGALAAGILHHRGYIHPSCLMVARRTLDELGVTFLDEKDRASRFDVAERVSAAILRRGGRLAGLARTASRRRGSRSEPVDLGASYEGIVYHQWYATRAHLARGRPVDDVPREAIELSLSELIDEGHREARDATVVVGVRAADAARLRNARAVLTALAFQDVARHRYRVVVVEQDSEPRLQAELAPLADRYLFAHNPGAYNRGWGLNVGMAQAGPERGAVCFLDADLLVPPDFLRRGLDALSGTARSLLPYTAVRYLTAADTERAIEERLSAPSASPDPSRLQGRRFHDSQGGALWCDAALYRAVGGHDERFRGWGFEDREMCRRLAAAAAAPRRLPGCLLHLDHPRTDGSEPERRANRALAARLRRERPRPATGSFGDPQRYASETSAPPSAPAPGRRHWEQWHRWDAARVDQIVAAERETPAAGSMRRALAALALRMGSRILDVGCGPAALQPHVAAADRDVSWTGVDVTHGMLAGARRSFPGASLVCADAAALPWRDGSFDVVLLRHVLEHVPDAVMERTVAEACRVARRAVLIAFYLPPSPTEARSSETSGEGFLETRWTDADVERPVASAGWSVRERLRLAGHAGSDVTWVLAPSAFRGALDLYPALPPAEPPLTISIVMPTFLRSHRLPATIATVLAQTYPHWQLIVVDNAGGCRLPVADPRVSLHEHRETSSAAHARNQGLRYATGDLVCFFDDDDDMFPSYLESLASAFRAHPRAKMVRCGMVVGGGRVNYSYATPEVCLRREYASPTWRADGPTQDQNYFQRIVDGQRWAEDRGDIVTVRAALCRANSDPLGGLRSGRY